MTRGERLNNPLNIRKSSSTWLGKIIPSSDPDFEEFDTPIDGIRAGAKNVSNDYKNRGLCTITQIISRWAPDNENDTAAYIADVSERTGFGSDDTLNLLDPSVLQPVVAAIIWHENGECIYDDALIAQAVQEALA